MKLKLLADLHISPYTVGLLRKAGYEIVRITELLPPTASDEEIIDLALREEAVIITQDLDFSSLIARRRLQFPSVISLRLTNPRPEVVAEILCRLLPRIEKDLIGGAIVSVDEKGFRIRKLPVDGGRG
ncbi:hypothetical protein DRP77_12285 [Candidatus Poribacteria bacterium]|nr:MAG: hypothetical protein DRP77_12285 [Candidatus Poribacteria bacterium]